MKYGKILASMIFFILIIMVGFTNKVSGEPETPSLIEDGKSAILIEPNTGKVLFEKNSHEKRPPASMTKIMSMYLIMEALDKGQIKWDDIVTVSAHAASMGGSQVWLEENEKMSVEDLFKCLAIASANDATVALAELVSGSEELFVQAMNEKVKSWGLKDTVFKDPTGLTDFADGHYSTAYDMSMMARRLIKDYGDVVLKYTSLYEDYIREDTNDKFWLVTTNKFVVTNIVIIISIKCYVYYILFKK